MLETSCGDKRDAMSSRVNKSPASRNPALIRPPTKSTAGCHQGSLGLFGLSFPVPVPVPVPVPFSHKPSGSREFRVLFPT